MNSYKSCLRVSMVKVKHCLRVSFHTFSFTIHAQIIWIIPQIKHVDMVNLTEVDIVFAIQDGQVLGAAKTLMSVS